MMKVWGNTFGRLIVSAFWLLSCVLSAQATSYAPPRSYKKVSPDSHYVFAMLTRVSPEDDAKRWSEPIATEVREIHRLYPQSGLYLNDGSSTPLWTVNWFAWTVAVPSDGVHLIRYNAWTSSTAAAAIGFYANGKLIREYTVSELTDLPLHVPFSNGRFTWMDSGSLDDTLRQYSLITRDGNSFVFDITTGNIVSQSRGGRIWLWIYITLGLMFILMISFERARRRNQRLINPLRDKIESLLKLLATAPHELAMHESLREASIRYKAGGGPPLGLLSRGSVMPDNTLNHLIWTARLWAFDPGVPAYFLAYKQALTSHANNNPSVDYRPVQQWLEKLHNLQYSRSACG